MTDHSKQSHKSFLHCWSLSERKTNSLQCRWIETMQNEKKKLYSDEWKTTQFFPLFFFLFVFISESKMIICVCLSFECQDYPVNGQKLHCLSVNFSSTTTTNLKCLNSGCFCNSIFMYFFFSSIFLYLSVVTYECLTQFSTKIENLLEYRLVECRPESISGISENQFEGFMGNSFCCA